MRIKVGNLYFGLRNNGVANVVGIDRENYLFLKEELIIPDKVEYKDHNYIVNYIDNGVFSNCRIKKIVIPKTVRIIRETAFYNSNLEKIVFLHDEGSEIFIGNRCFYRCKRLEEISLPEGVISIKVQTFCDCTELKRVNLPNTLAKIEYGSFSGCTNLEKIIIPGSVKLIGDNAFSLCTKLIGNVYFQGIPPSYSFMGDSIFPRNKKNKELNTIHINPEYFSYFIGNPSFDKFSFLDNEGTSIESAIYRLDNKNKTAVVIPKLDKYCLNRYKGTVYILDKIVQNKIEYVVTGIEEFAFTSCPDLKKVILPSLLKLGPLDIFDSGNCKIEYYEVPSEKDQDSYI